MLKLSEITDWQQAINQVVCADCLDFMKIVPDNSVDSIITDPPAGISFMGKEWDTFDKSMFGKKGKEGINDLKVKKNFEILPRYGNADLLGFQNFICAVFIEAIRILKPGGHALVWAIPRTSHHTAMGLERAGFEIRDCIYHIFGCLSEDTEILTINGWERYHKNIDKYPVLCYDINNDKFEFYKPIKKYYYENKYPAYRIQSDYTDQIVSRNHRVIVEREGKLLFSFAEDLAWEQKASIPFLESLSDLPETIPNVYEGTSITKQDLFQRMQRQENIIKQEGRFIREESRMDKNKMCLLWEGNRNPQGTKKIQPKKLLLSFLSCQGPYKAFASLLCKWQGKNKTRNWTIGREKSCMERRSNIFSQTWELCFNKICQMSERILGNGTQGWLCYGTSINNGSIIEQMPTESRNSSPYQSQSTRQPNRESATIQNQSRTQKIRRTKATITEIKYKGNVWCVEVPTGAFVARRNGKIFITGNSGFPKSLNIGKAVDKLQGNKRIKGKLKFKGGSQLGVINDDNWKPKDVYEDNGNGEYEGYGTALKPAVECWWLCRKPISEKTVAENVLKWGTGGINIDECRVETSDKISGSGKGFLDEKGFGCIGRGNKTESNNGQHPQGRFPANLITDGSDEVLAMFPQSAGQRGNLLNHNKDRQSPNGCFGKMGPATDCLKRDDFGSVARFFYCAKASKSERDMGCEELSHKSAGEVTGGRKEGSAGLNSPRAGAGRISGAKNFHPTVKPLALMRYLTKLITPANGIVLDPFAGSGSTLIACRQLGHKFIGIEIDKEYCRIAEHRLAHTETSLFSGGKI